MQVDPQAAEQARANPHSNYWLKRWYAIVKEYSARQLTYQNDRLPALGGLAALISAMTSAPFDPERGLYIAGLWHADLLRQLCWYPDLQFRSPLPANVSWPPHLTPAPPSSVNAAKDASTLPSWSWISTNKPVCYYGMDEFDGDALSFSHLILEPWRMGRTNLDLDDMIPKVHASHVDLCIPSFRFGAVSAGIITVSGLALETIISQENHLSQFNSPLLPKCYSILKNWKRPVSSWGHNPAGIVSQMGVVYFDSDPRILPKVTLLCLRLGSKQSLVSAAKPVDVGLVLLEVKEAISIESKSQTRVRRVGIFEWGVWQPQFLEKAAVRTFISSSLTDGRRGGGMRS
jgi:hypothetical protein